MLEIVVFNDSEYKRAPKKLIKELLAKVLKREGIKKARINIIYNDDSKIRIINKRYLQHNYSTDVICFDLSDGDLRLGEIYINLDAASRQSKDYNVSFTTEIKRLAIHGALHFAGYNDNSRENKDKMTSLENKFLGMI